MSPNKKSYDRLAELLANVPPERIRKALVKTEAITIRLTPADKAEIQLAAKACGMTLTDYLLGLHQLVVRKLVSEDEA